MRIRFADLPPKLPPKGFGMGQHYAALLCTHGTKSVLSLGTQHYKTQQKLVETISFNELFSMSKNIYFAL